MPDRAERPAPVELGRTLVAEAMHAGVVTCSPHVSLEVVARIMAAHRIHAVVVSEPSAGGGPPVVWGVVSDLDVLDAVVDGSLGQLTAGEVSAAGTLVVRRSDPLDRAVELMRAHRTTHVVVVDRVQGRPVGVVSTLDVAEILSRLA